MKHYSFDRTTLKQYQEITIRSICGNHMMFFSQQKDPMVTTSSFIQMWVVSIDKKTLP